jgi:NAD(P)H-dependent flavin oxidoreductase YrpB (nitropropane dioxygenase family)
VTCTAGSQAGGHGLAASLPIITLLKDILSAPWLPFQFPVVAAGGISSPSSLREILEVDLPHPIGGYAIGTRLCATPESLLSDDARGALVEAKGNARGFLSTCQLPPH